ncbi:MAG: hypothetical protein HC927_04845 [Deltaproteobacteria bacterium]|nr:hypothetical protein [Deltaproteobacteria bacterium]
MSRHLTALVIAGALMVPSSALASSRLCASVPSYCIYTDHNAPVLEADVCFSATTGAILKGASGCPKEARPYFVEHGEIVDPMSGAVAAYIPLDNACSVPGVCVAPPDGHNPGPGYPICCDDDDQCTNYQGGACAGTLYFCIDGVCNEDGTVTCFESHEVG